MTNQLSGRPAARGAGPRAGRQSRACCCLTSRFPTLDAKLRVQMRTEIRRIQQKLGITAIYVTHDQSEAMAISDQIIIMKKGVIAQMGSPMDIYYHPVDEFVADFIGEANFLKGSRQGHAGNACVVTVEGRGMTVGADGRRAARAGVRDRARPSHPHRRNGNAPLQGGTELLHGQLSELPCAGGGYAGEDQR